MRYLGFLFALIFTLGLAIALSINLGQAPPLGKLFDPFHGFWQNAYSEDALAKEEIHLENLLQPVEVVYDENLIPHIYAQNELDLFRAQGYVVAQHRLWQMEFQTLAAAGRVSEIVGSQAIEYDRMQRRKGLGYGAEMGEQFIRINDPETYALVEAFADGINQYIDQLNLARLPVEYKILNYRPEYWNPYKTSLLLMYMADMLVDNKDLEYTNLVQMLGPELMNKLFPDFPLDNDPVIEPTKKWDFKPIKTNKPANLVYPDSSILFDPLPAKEPGIGSNNWAVAGKKTRRGYPILANDPHLGLNMPSLWYAMQLSTPEFHVKGVCLPGALGIISGFNEDIAWGVTNATRDVQDWYAITFRDFQRTEYLYNDQWIQSTIRIEEIKVKNEASFIDSVIYTHHGPVVFDKNFRSNNQKLNFALKWTGHLGSNEQATFLGLNKAKNHDDYLEAIHHFTAPAQNFVFASKSGDIAIKVQGMFPLKWKEQGKYLMDGNNPIFEWAGFIPNEQNPATLNPARGFVSSANQHSVDPSYPYYVFDNSFEHFRNRRLNNRLKEMNDITVDDMKALQFDNYYLLASEALNPMMELLLLDSALLTSPEHKNLIEKLQKWNFHTHPNQEAPTLFYVWWNNFKKAAWGKWESEGKPVVFPNDYQIIQLLKNEPEHPVWNDPSTAELETAGDLLRNSFLEMVTFIRDWEGKEENYQWANYKKTSIQHLVPNFESFSYKNISTGGGRGILNATSERNGASWRMVVELGNKVTAFGIYPGGQSGNPGSRFYGNMIRKWANGEYLNFNLRKPGEEEGMLFKTTLIPEL
ncbi:penicillin acylase family protein [Pararhodonellum marinum]|uniref:penicillin acylase family protein n=1 Tax=Pararhodonellum marinum TaxID=2755358 RepID=UPI00188F4BE4|nr:penicillin acylase family protein [Pararhodonellum marinum]